MDVRAEILKEHSRQQSEKIAAWIGNDKERFAAFMHLFLHDEYRVVQRAAWALSIIAENNFGLVEPYLELMVKKMNTSGIHVAVKRNVVRILQCIDIPKPLHGNVMNCCFDFLADTKETVAVRVFSMRVLGNLADTYPDIKPELKAIIEGALQNGVTPGFRSCAQKILASLNKKAPR